MNNKYNSFYHLTKLKCIDDEDIILLEKKVNSFSIDEKYNYGLSISSKICILPNLNLDFEKIEKYYEKLGKINSNDFFNELKVINKYIKKIIEPINMKVIEGLKEQYAIYYLFQFVNQFYFYIFLNPNIQFPKICKDTDENINMNEFNSFYDFFSNYILILNSAKLYLSNDIFNTQLNELGEEKKLYIIKNLRIHTNLGLYLSFKEINSFPKEFEKLINNCQKVLSSIVNILGNNRLVFDDENYNNKNLFNTKINIMLENYIKSLEILHSINEIYNIIDYKYFYNNELNHNFDIKKEFNLYKKNQYQVEISKNQIINENNNNEFNINTFKTDMHNLTFTLLSYTWLFNASSKYILINLYNDNSQKDILLESVFNLLNENNTQQSLDNLNLTLSVRRDNLIEDTLEQISKQNINLRSPLKIDFIGEEGIDQGGLKKEFFMLITRKIFADEYNLFSYNSKTNLFWFNLSSTHQSKNYELIGIIFGLAIYNSIILDIKFPLALYKKLLQVEPSLEDLKEVDIELYKNFCYILDSDEEDLEDKLDSNFTVITENNGDKIVLPLIENGENIMINNENKKEYIDLYIDWYFNKSIEDYYSSFQLGFNRVFDEDLLKILTPEELELILCGSSNLNFYELQKVCIYKDGYNKESLTIKYFWEVVFNFDEEEKRKLLSFITGCDKAPINGLGKFTISITRIGTDINKLPSAHTCFNDLLLPDYKNKELLKKFLLIAINFSEGFGLS